MYSGVHQLAVREKVDDGGSLRCGRSPVVAVKHREATRDALCVSSVWLD